jgi:6-phosphofructokinase 1
MKTPLAPGSRIGVLTSGGDSPGMNPALRAAVKMIGARGHVPVGILDGYRGLIDCQARDLRSGDVVGLERMGGTFLGSARALDFLEAEGQERAQESVRRLGLDALIVIGGNGSLAGAHVCSRFSTSRGQRLRVVGVPASIDNDIGYSSSAIGVDTALNTIVEACDKISDTAASHRRAFFVEVMGRECGYLAMAAGISAGADAVLFREGGASEEEQVARVVKVIDSASHSKVRNRVLILKAEGVKISLETLKQRVDEELHRRGLTVETRVTVLGHVVRGGAPSAFDRLLAGRLVRAAVWAAIEGETDVMIGWQSRAVTAGVGHLSKQDPYCAVVPLPAVFEETAHLLDGSSPVTKWRIRALVEAEDVLSY